MVRRPRILMDEPLSNLDANLRVQMRSEIVARIRRSALLVYVTHDQTEARRCRPVAVVDGMLLQVASPADIYFDLTDLRRRSSAIPRINLLACGANADGQVFHRATSLGLALARRPPAPACGSLSGCGPSGAAGSLGPVGPHGVVRTHEHLGGEVLVQAEQTDGAGK